MCPSTSPYFVDRKPCRRSEVTTVIALSHIGYPQYPVYPYSPRKMVIDRPNQVWCADITFVPVRNGFLYLVAIMDWATRKVLSWRL